MSDGATTWQPYVHTSGKRRRRRRRITLLPVGMGYISYIVISRAHNNHTMVVLQLSSYRYHVISGAPPPSPVEN